MPKKQTIAEIEAELKLARAAEAEGAKMKGAELERLLKKAGMSRRSFGRAVGVMDTTVGRWVRGKTSIGLLEGMGIVLYFRQAHGIESNWSPRIKAVA